MSWTLSERRSIEPVDLDALSDEELVLLARRGDERALNIVLVRYRALVRSRAKSYFLPGWSNEDVIQEAMIGLFGAVKTFDVKRGVPFAAFASFCVVREIFSAIKAANRGKNEPLNRAASLDIGPESEHLGGSFDELQTPGAPADPADLAIAANEVEAIRNFLRSRLTRLERVVLHLYLGGSSYSIIAEILGRDVKAVDNALQRARFKLDRELDLRMQNATREEPPLWRMHCRDGVNGETLPPSVSMKPAGLRRGQVLKFASSQI